MRLPRKPKRTMLLLVLLLPIAIGLGLVGFAGTGAYFTDTHNGTITGSIGSIRVAPSGGSGTDSMDFGFANMLPGESQTITLDYQNTGANNQDIWLKFPNATALSALNNLGTYGEAHVGSNGTEIFASTNLNDRVATCGALSPTGCWPLPTRLKIASNVAPGHTGTVTFTFNYASKMKTPPPVFNSYPVAAGQYSPSNPDGQTTVNTGDGSGNGLPWQLVATQLNQMP